MLRRAPLSGQSPGFPDLHVEVESRTASSETLYGGDFYDVIPLDGGNVALVLGDVCGKGIAAALHVPGIKLALRAFLTESRSPAYALACLNGHLCGGTNSGCGVPNTFAAASIVVIDRATGAGSCCTAGADPPLILRKHGPSGVLHSAGMMLGIRPGEVYPESRFCLNACDALLLVTDGITEARRGKEFLGYDGVVEFATRAWAARKPQGACPCGVAQTLFLEARHFAGGALHDDASVLVVERSSK